MGIRKTLALVVAGVMLLVVLVLGGKVVENVDANQIVVIQDPIDGELHWYNTAGIKWQGFGRVTAYPKRAIYDFKCGEYKEGTSESQCAEGTIDGRISFVSMTAAMAGSTVRFSTRCHWILPI